jgi:hypothetical protein
MKETTDSDKARALVCETNPVSHRTALILDNGSEVFLFVTPRSAISSPPGRLDFAESCLAYLYRHPRPPGAGGELDREKRLREISFPVPPVIDLLWDEAGQCVAALVNGEPWAFVHPDHERGFSKGAIGLPAGNTWDERLFAQTFKR